MGEGPGGQVRVELGGVGFVDAVAVLCTDGTSYVGVRARGMEVLFATCHDEEPLQEIRGRAGE